MRSRQVLPAVLVALVVLPLSACSEDPAPDTGAVGTSALAPENSDGKAEAGRDGRAQKKAKAVGQRQKALQGKAKRHGARTRPATAETGDATTGADTGSGTGAGRAGSPAAAPQRSGPLRATVPDPTGDVRGSLTGAPPYADLAGATLTRDDAFEVRVSFAGAVPRRQTDDRIVQVATFYDLDDDGETDYEVWASLADNGWGTSYRTPDGARYGEDSGVRALPDGNDLVITFPLTHLRRTETTAWAVGAEWGTLEQVASGTTSKDNAPDGGWARFPG